MKKIKLVSVKSLCACIWMSFLVVSVSAQDSVSKYPFIKQQYNHLYFSNDSSSFVNLFEKLDKLKAGDNKQIKIVHMGGSHVQGGTWSNVFLTAFQNQYQTAGGGYFVFPYKIGRTNSQPYASSFSNGKWKLCRSIGKDFCLPLGMNALSITTNDSANYFGVALTTKSACKYVNVVKVFHNFNSSFEFNLCTKDSFKVIRNEFPLEGYTLFTLDMPADSLFFELYKKDTLQQDFILYGISLENNMTPGFYLAGLGANGASASSFLRCSQLVPQLQALQGDLFILSLGVNDSQSKGFTKEDFIQNYDSLITFIKQANPKAAIILSTTTDNFIRYKTPNKRTLLARDAAFELMNKHNVAVWDLFSIMGGYRSMLNWQRYGLAVRDKVHFTGRGYTIVGNLMFEAVYKSYNNSQLKK